MSTTRPGAEQSVRASAMVMVLSGCLSSGGASETSPEPIVVDDGSRADAGAETRDANRSQPAPKRDAGQRETTPDASAEAGCCDPPVYPCVLEPALCDDADACTVDRCHVAHGCQHVPLSCDDGDPCTDDGCDPVRGCQHTPASCDDGDACTADACDEANGACVALPIACDDGDACTVDGCDPAHGCRYAPLSCDDGNPCTEDACASAIGCRYTPLACDDGDPCTVDACDAARGGCVSVPLACDDADMCTLDSCHPVAGCRHTPLACDDGDPCTDDACDPAAGCVTAWNAASCDDGDPCTGDDVCAEGECRGSLRPCGAGNPCGEDACAPCEVRLAVQSFGGAGFDRAEGVALSADGSAYVTGAFTQSAAFGGAILESAGAEDVFLFKLRLDGTVEWARSAGGALEDWGRSVALGDDGSVYITGYYHGPARFGTHMLSGTGLRLFLAKYDSKGVLQWVRSAGGPGVCSGRGVVAHGGSVSVTGGFTERCTFGNVSVDSAGRSDIFVAQFTSEGSLRWVQRAGGIGFDGGAAVAVSGDGSIYVTGDFHEPASFGGDRLMPTGGYEMFVARYDPEGALTWARAAASQSYSYGSGVAGTGDGGVYVTGRFGESVRFEGETLNAREGAFVVRYGPTGTVSWARALDGAQSVGLAVTQAAGDGAFVTGGTFQIGSAATYTQAWVAELPGDGASVELQRATSHSQDWSFGRSIAGNDCSVAVAGDFVGTWSFNGTRLSAEGSEDVFVIRLAR